MTFNKILIIQYGGIGDILFGLKIAYKLYEKYGIKPEWAIRSEIMYMANYIDAPVTFVPFTSMYEKYMQLKHCIEIDGELIIPIQNANSVFPTPIPIMLAKYMLVNLPWEDWSSYIKIKRNTEKENQLYDIVVGNKQDYIIVNNLYSTPPHVQTSSYVPVFENAIQHQFIDNYNIFDWLKVYQNAKEIHTVSTCLIYIFEALSEKMPETHIYNRDCIYTLDQLRFLVPTLKQKQILHELH